MGASHQDGKADGSNGEKNGGPGRKPGEQVGCAARPKGRLRSLAAESPGEVCALTLLQQDDTNQKERDDDVNHYDETE